jgi:hypothetical protein
MHHPMHTPELDLDPRRVSVDPQVHMSMAPRAT